MNGENVLRVLVIMLLGNPATAMVLNGVLPLLVFIASARVIVTNLPTTITVGGSLYFVIPLATLLASLAGFRLRRLPPALFWLPWAVNLAIVAFLFYLSFFFKIS